jgi:catechol 2,3-dioxygenase-like lactoylglutathione lyase family enzyme
MADFRHLQRPLGLPFRIAKLGHVVLNVGDLERSVRFYTQVLGFAVSDVYPPELVPGGMVFMRCNADHHGVDQVGSDGAVRPAAEWKGAHSLAAAIADPVRGQDTTLHDATLLDT